MKKAKHFDRPCYLALIMLPKKQSDKKTSVLSAHKHSLPPPSSSKGVNTKLPLSKGFFAKIGQSCPSLSLGQKQPTKSQVSVSASKVKMLPHVTTRSSAKRVCGAPKPTQKDKEFLKTVVARVRAQKKEGMSALAAAYTPQLTCRIRFIVLRNEGNVGDIDVVNDVVANVPALLTTVNDDFSEAPSQFTKMPSSEEYDFSTQAAPINILFDNDHVSLETVVVDVADLPTSNFAYTVTDGVLKTETGNDVIIGGTPGMGETDALADMGGLSAVVPGALNVYVTLMSEGVVGFAGINSNFIVIHRSTVAGDQRTLTHEIGHALGLPHIWDEDTPFTDTPPQILPNNGQAKLFQRVDESWYGLGCNHEKDLFNSGLFYRGGFAAPEDWIDDSISVSLKYISFSIKYSDISGSALSTYLTGQHYDAATDLSNFKSFIDSELSGGFPLLTFVFQFSTLNVETGELWFLLYTSDGTYADLKAAIDYLSDAGRVIDIGTELASDNVVTEDYPENLFGCFCAHYSPSIRILQFDATASSAPDYTDLITYSEGLTGSLDEAVKVHAITDTEISTGTYRVKIVLIGVLTGATVIGQAILDQIDSDKTVIEAAVNSAAAVDFTILTDPVPAMVEHSALGAADSDTTPTSGREFFTNHMDYTDDSHMIAFSEEQGAVMRTSVGLLTDDFDEDGGGGGGGGGGSGDDGVDSAAGVTTRTWVTVLIWISAIVLLILVVVVLYGLFAQPSWFWKI